MLICRLSSLVSVITSLCPILLSSASHLSYRSIQVRYKGSTHPTFRKITPTVHVMVDRTLYGVSVNHTNYCSCNEWLTVPLYGVSVNHADYCSCNEWLTIPYMECQ